MSTQQQQSSQQQFMMQQPNLMMARSSFQELSGSQNPLNFNMNINPAMGMDQRGINGGGGPASGIPNTQSYPDMQQKVQQRTPEKKLPPAKANLTNREKGFYSNLLNQADSSGSNKVGGQEAVTFFKRSGVHVDTLKNIWKIAARTSNEYLTRDEFYVALRLIAYAQNGIQPNEESLKFDIPVDLPRFDPGPLALPAPQKERPEILAEDIAKSLPDLDNLNLEQFNNIQSLIPSINQKEQQKQQQNMQQQMVKQQQMMQKQMMEQAQQSPWFIQQEDLSKYSKIFDHFDTSKAGHLDDQHMQGVFKQTQLPREICEKVWELVNPSGGDVFDKKMFAMAMHFLFRAKQGVQLPNRAPQEMFISLDPQGFLQSQQKMNQQQMQQQQPNMPQANQRNNPYSNQQPQQNIQKQIPESQPLGLSQNPIQPSQNQKLSDNLLDLVSSQPQSQQNLSKSQIQINNPPPQQRIQQSSQLMHKRNSSFGTDQIIAPHQNISPNHFNQSQQHNVQHFQTNIPPSVTQAQVQQRQEEVNFLTSVYQQDQQIVKDVQTENVKLKTQLDDLDKEFSQLKLKIESQRKLLEQERSKSQLLKQQVDERYQQVQKEKQTYETVISDRMQVYEQNNQYNQQISQQYNTQSQNNQYNQSQNNNNNPSYQDSYAHNYNDYGHTSNHDQQDYNTYNKQYTDASIPQRSNSYDSVNNLRQSYAQQQNHHDQNNYNNYDYSTSNVGNGHGTSQQTSYPQVEQQQQQQQNQWVSFDNGVETTKKLSGQENELGFDFGGSKFDFDSAYNGDGGNVQHRFDFS